MTQQYSPPPRTTQRTSGMAIVSLLSSLSVFVGIPIVGSIIGIVTGNMAKKEIKESEGVISGESMAQLGIVIGWFGLALWGICSVIAILFGAAPIMCGACALLIEFLSNVSERESSAVFQLLMFM